MMVNVSQDAAIFDETLQVLKFAALAQEAKQKKKITYSCNDANSSPGFKRSRLDSAHAVENAVENAAVTSKRDGDDVGRVDMFLSG